MKAFKNFTSDFVAFALLLASTVIPASAQSFGNSYTIPAQVQSYRSTAIGLVPAASATDFLTIVGSTTTSVRIKKIHCSGVSTAAATSLIQVVKRSAADTGGTATQPTILRLNVSNPVATAVVNAYTANPTLGTIDSVAAAGYLTTNTLASSAIQNDGLDFDFTNQWLVIGSSPATVALNANGVSFSAGTSLACWVEWSEV